MLLTTVLAMKISGVLAGFYLTIFLSPIPVAASLKDIEHVIIFMQENRSWDTYFGTMAGARGFNDPNVQVNPDGLPVWFQPVDPNMSNDTKTLLPWYLGYLGGQWPEAIQCMAAGSNGYQENHAAINSGLNNGWARNNTPWSWGYLKRQDIPVQFALAEGWTVGDMYQQSQITATNPNRVTLVSGSINAPGSPQTPDQGGVYLDNNETPGCEEPQVNCYPLKWKTTFEFYEEAGVSWQVFQGQDNFDDNPLAWFEQYQTAPPDSPLSKKGMAFPGLDAFFEAAQLGTLPQVSFIVGPRELSEHAPYSPKDGGWLQQRVVNAVVKSPKYGSSVLMVSYDESGGWGDHVPPYHSPENTPGEWVEDYLGLFGKIYTGPGMRVPFYIISPWTRGGHVFTEHADHNSQILFIEEWLTAKGYNGIHTDQMVPWRRAHMSNLVNAFDFENPNLSIPDMPMADTPHKDSRGNWDGSAYCESRFASPRPPVPYSSQPDELPQIVEEGYKPVSGNLTEGRYLVFEDERTGYLLSHDFGSDPDPDPGHHNDNDDNNCNLNITVPSTGQDSDSRNQKQDYRDPRTRWILHYYNNNNTDIAALATSQETPFLISSADRKLWLSGDGALVPYRWGSVPVDIQFRAGRGGSSIDQRASGNGDSERIEEASRGYTLRYADDVTRRSSGGTEGGGFISIGEDGQVTIGDDQGLWNVFSVTYYD